LFSQKKKPKKRLPRYRLFPSVLAPHLGGCGTRFAQTVLAAFHLPLKPKARQRGLKVKTMRMLCKIDALRGVWISASRASILSFLK
jgi:hypothetical protein